MKLRELRGILNATKLTILMPRSKERAVFSGTEIAEAFERYGPGVVTAISADGEEEQEDGLVCTCDFPLPVPEGDVVIGGESIFAPKTKYGYQLNIRHEKIAPLYDRFREWRGIGKNTPLSDAERFEFEARVLAGMVKRKMRGDSPDVEEAP